jgi:hypothetical protein
MDLPVREKLPHTIPHWVAEGSWFFITSNCLPPGKNQLCLTPGAHGVTRPAVGDAVLAMMCSANGAMLASAWDDAPGIRLHKQQALKARFNQARGSNSCRK